jgi:hypothetical protein
VHDQTSRTGIDRRDGFVERIKSTYPNIKIVSVQYGGGDHLKSTEVTKSILQAYPNLKGMFGANEGSAIGVLNGAREMKRKIVVIGYDSGKQQKDAIKDGSMAGAITQNPVGIGYKTVEAAVKALKGEKLPKVIDTGFYWYDKTTSTTRRSRRSCTTDGAGAMATIRALRVLDVRFPTSRTLDGLRRNEPRAGLFGGLRRARDRHARARGARPRIHDRARHRGRLRGDRGAAPARRRPRPRLDRAGHGALLAPRHLRLAAALIGPRQGRDAPGDRCGRQRGWDLWAKASAKPVWRLVADMSPHELLRCIDLRYLSDCIGPDEALALLQERERGKAERLAALQREGYPCYTTSAGWLGYDDAKLRRLVPGRVDAGFGTSS